MEFYHKPIMVEEVLTGLALKENGVYFDATCGGAGHSFAILSALSSLRLIATDRDSDAIEAANKRLQPFEGRYRLFKSDYKNFEAVLDEANETTLDGVLVDCGISSHQIDTPERGFSYLAEDAPLDMRMDQTSALTAETVVNEYPEEKLRFLLKAYGEENFARAIARSICSEREKKRIATTGALRSIAESAYPVRLRTPAVARKTFQAIRIEVNGELEGLKECLAKFVRRLKKGGRICVLTFHSLEDRIVKELFREMAESCTCPKSFPVCVCGKKQEIQIITKKPLTASEAELRENSRAKSAKLRIAERI